MRDGWTWRPPRSDVLLSLRWAAFLTVLFPVAYLTCNWITARRPAHWKLWMDWELGIPFVPSMVWVYLSIFVYFFLPMFALREASLNALCRRLVFAVLVSAAVFLLLPAQVAFPRPTEVPGYETAFRVIYLFDLPGNSVPSLHVSWSTLFLLTLREPSPPWLRRVLAAWLIALCASVLLVHQHHVIDIAGGVLVALAARHVIRADGAWAWRNGEIS